MNETPQSVYQPVSDPMQVCHVLDDLKRAARSLLAGREEVRVTYTLFARAGFTAALQDVAQREGALLIKVDEMIAGGSISVEEGGAQL